MRYIGGKTDLLCNINAACANSNAQSVIDIFSGSGAVSQNFAKTGIKVISNDLLFFSYVINRALITVSELPSYDNLPINNPIDYLNSLEFQNSGIDINDCFIWQNYSLHDGCSRMYLQEHNALKIDIIRLTIESWKNRGLMSENEYYYLLSRLLAAVPGISNIAGVYGAYLKFWDPRSFKPLLLTDYVQPFAMNTDNIAYNQDYKLTLKSVSADLLYADPPYNSRQYLPNYHILETIARYDYPTIHGVSGMREYNRNDKSDFCSKSKVSTAFEDLIKLADVGHILISYNNEGLMPTDSLCELCRSYSKDDTFQFIQIPYKRYKSNEGEERQVFEQLYYFAKK